MEPVLVKLPPRAHVRLEKYGVQLTGPVALVANAEIIGELLRVPGICRIDAQEVVDKGWFSAEAVRAMGHEVRSPGEPAPAPAPVPAPAPIPVVSVPKLPDFAAMTLPELREHAERLGLVIKRGWNKDDIVAEVREAALKAKE